MRKEKNLFQYFFKKNIDDSNKKSITILELKKKSSEIFKKRSEIMIIYVYGSFIHKQMHKFSDIDIGIVVSHWFHIDSFYSINIQ
ncbi:MAG: nucleotidyltransferase domain-containing protein [Promethearchaeota archaeon]